MKTPAFFQRSELAATLWTFRCEFFMVGLFSMVANLLMLTPTIYMLQVYDRVLSSQSELTLLAVSLIALFLFGTLAVSEWTRSRVLVRAGMRFDAQLGTRVFNSSFDAYLSESGNTPSRAFGDLMQVRQFLTGSGIFAFLDAPWSPIYLGVTFMLHPFLGVIAVCFGTAQAGVAWFGHRTTVAPTEEASRAAVEVSSYVQSKLRNVEVIEAMGMLENLRGRWRTLQDAYLARHSNSHAASERMTAISKFLRYSQQSLSLGAGALLVIDGQLSPGAMIAANLLMGRALAPIDQLVQTWRTFVSARAAFHRLEKLLQEFPERGPNLSRTAPKGEITLRNVFATAPSRQQPILKDINLRVAPGTVVGVIGASGSGRSTLARVMMGIWPHMSGEVLIDGLPLQSWNRAELGPHLGYLPQDIELFEGSIAENIARFGEINSAKVIEAARTAGLHEMILRFPKGYDTPIGEAGRLLSGGQRQRIGVARAVYGEPALLVLDEPNANLDDAGELALRNTVVQLKAKGKTVFLITHRPGILGIVDDLLVLVDGRVSQHGPRDEVLQRLHAEHRATTAAATQSPAGPALAGQPA